MFVRDATVEVLSLRRMHLFFLSPVTLVLGTKPAMLVAAVFWN